MKRVASVETNISHEDKLRKSLQELQPPVAAADKEILFSGDIIKLPQQSDDGKLRRDVEKTKHVQNTKSTSKLSNKMAKDQAIQTEKKEKEIMPEDLTTTERSEYYWELLAERKRKALIDTLEENKELDEKLKKSEEHGRKLEEEIDLFKEMVENTKALVTELADKLDRGDHMNDTSDINNSLEDSVL
ncbi:geminin [Pseudomyrmex gracilis]|uniref:geminin n=1 Tax=Pseudomyrmex gracilis TaxID=219809 RepID=UPI000994E6A6|nr:geminin [Pseudomyrmex gracilis]